MIGVEKLRQVALNGTIRFESPTMVAGVIVEDGVIVRTAPIVSFMKGWKAERALEFAKHRLWDVELLGG